MASSSHSIRSQTLDVAVATETLALALQPRMSDLNRQRLLPVIDRVLGEFDVPGRHIRIDRLMVDLGVLPLSALEERAEAALEHALREALAATLAAMGDGPGADARTGAWPEGAATEASPEGAAPAARSEGEARLALLEHFLSRGTLPFWADRGAFAADAFIAGLLTSEPAELTALIRRLGRERKVLERLVLQLDEATLQAVLALIEPAHAALIIAYMMELRQVHRVAPLMALGEPAFARQLWLLTFAYLLRDAGSQFNRRSYVRALLEQIAAGEAVEFAALVATLARGLRAAARQRPPASSLPAVIEEIVRELKDASPDRAAALAADPAALAALIRRHGRDRTALQRMVGALDEAALRAVLALLEPVHAALIIAYMIELRQVHRVAPLMALGEAAFARQLWLLTFAYLLRDAGSEFNRRSYVRALLEQIAAGEAVEFAALMATLARGLRATAQQRPPAASLPAVIEAIADELGIGRGDPERDAAAGNRAAAPSAARDAAALADLIRGHGHDRHVLEQLVRELDDDMLQAVLALIEPAHAALIIAYMIELRQVHRVAPLMALGEAAFARQLWLLTFTYLLRDAGSEFNRRSYVRALLEQVAANEAVEFAALVTTLARGLRAAARQRPPASSLPAVIEAIADEFGIGRGDPERDAAAGNRVVAPSAARDAAALAELIRGHGHDRHVLEQLVGELDEATLRAVLVLLAPAQAAAIVASMIELRQAHRVVPLAALADIALARLLWTLALSCLPRDAGAEFDPGSFLRMLLTRIAESLSIGLPALAATLEQGLHAAAAVQPPASSLPAVIGDILQEYPHREAPPEPIRFDGPSRIIDRYDRIDALDHFLRHGFLPPDILLRRPDLTVEGLAEQLATLDAGRLQALFATEPVKARHALLLRAIRLLGPTRFGILWRQLLARPADAAASPSSPFGDTLLEQALAAAAAVAPDLDLLHARLLSALIDGEELDLDVLTLPPSDLHRSAAPDEPAAWPVQRLEAELVTRLRDDIPPAAGRGLDELVEMLSSRHPHRAARLFQAIAAAPVLAARLEILSGTLRETVERLMAAGPSGDRASPPSALVRDAVFAWLGGEATAPRPPLIEAELRAAVADVAAAFPEQLARVVAAHAGRAELRARWVATLPDSALLRLAHAMEPHRIAQFLDAAEFIHRAAFAIADATARRRMRRASLWEALFDYLATHGAAERSPGAFVTMLLARAGDQRERIRIEARHLAAAAGRQALVAAMARPRASPRPAPDGRTRTTPAAKSQPERPRPLRARTAFGLGESEEVERGEPIYIDNAGLVLAGVFLPQLFERLDLLARPDGRAGLRDADAASRAVHLLQYLVDGRCDAPEPALVLNKLLCGLSVGTPVLRAIEPTADELSLCDGLLRAMVAQWEIISSNSSVAALRETFLQRSGRLARRADAWTLRVERKTVDVLVDRIPWSIAVIYHPWMPESLHVTW